MFIHKTTYTVSAEKSSASRSVVTKYREGDADLVLLWTLGSDVYCEDCKTFRPVPFPY